MYPSRVRGVSGPAPKFNDFHIWKALTTLDDAVPMGRKRLSSVLGIGEGSTRTLLNILLDNNFVTIGNMGILLTDLGVKFKNAINMEIKPVKTFDLTIGEHDCAVLVRRASKKITSYGCDERDSAILAGALGATTLTMHNNRLVFPGNDYPVDEKNRKSIKSEFNIKNDDVIIIGTADDFSVAECGAVTAALNLIGGLKIERKLNDILDPNSSAKEIISLAFAIHELVGGFPVFAKSANSLGVRIENGAVVDNAYTSDLLEKSIAEGVTIRTVAESGPYKGMSVIITPIDLDGKVVASIGVVDIGEILISAHP